MASPSNTNTGGNVTKEANPETASNPAGSPHDSSNAGTAENPPNNLQPVELKEGSSPLVFKEPIPSRQCYKIPSYASWFSWNKIHATERRFLIEFFDGKSPSKTPERYKEYRDFIINKFLENPLAKITFTQVRRMLVGDVNSIRRVFDFLENWGLVNYQVASKHHLKSANAAAAAAAAPASSVTPTAARVASPAKPAAACDRPLSATSTVVDRAGLASRRDAFANKQSGRARLFCKHCRVECTNSRYDCLKEEASPKSADEGMPEEPGSFSGANDGNAEEQKISREDPQKEITTMVTENLKDDKNEEQAELTGNKDQMLNKSDKLLRCPRCDSLGTKFCYYNNYNMNQPRHFCKSCQRYWTAGGTMRNVPVGAGRRKNKHSALHYWHMMRSDGFMTETADDPDAAHCQAGFVLCPKCFADGNYGLGLSASDFKQVVLNEPASQKGSDKWTDQDTLLLLEAILLYSDDWKRVAQHVGTKSEADCVTRFIQLPFGEQFKGYVGTVGSDQRLSNIKGEKMVTKLLSSPKDSSTQDHQNDAGYDDKHTIEDDVSGPALKRRHLTPLADASNPIMAQVAFLSGMVGSRPAEAAARAAIAALCEEDPCASQIEETKFTNQKNGSTASGLEGVGKDSELEASKKELNGGTDQTTKDGEFYPSAKNMVSLTPETRATAATDLGAAAIRAKHLADQEDQDIEHLFSTIMETEMKKLQDKIQHFEELDFIMDKERSQVEQIKELLVADRIRFLQQTMNSEFSGSQEKGVG